MGHLRICSVDLSEWERNFLATTVGLAAGTEIALWTHVADPEHADVLIVNGDARSSAHWRQRSREAESGRPWVVLLADAPPADAAAASYLLRPITYPSVIRLLRELQSRLQEPPATPPPVPSDASARRAGSAAPTPAASADAALIVQRSRKFRRSARFFENSRLLGIVRRAIALPAPLEITHPHFQSLIIDPLKRFYISEQDPCLGAEAFRMPALEFRTQAVIRPALGWNSGATHQPLTRLLYCAAYYGSEGRFLADWRMDDRLELIHVPDLELLPGGAEQHLILQTLAGGPIAVRDLVMCVGEPFDAFIDAVNGFEAIGCIVRTRNGVALERAAESLHRSAAPQSTDTIRGKIRALMQSLLPDHDRNQ